MFHRTGSSGSKKNDRSDSASPRRWTYRGAGSDHEIVVRLRESTPTSADDDEDTLREETPPHQTPRTADQQNRSSDKESSVVTSTTISSPSASPPDRLPCAICKRSKASKDFWWCRTCQKTLCSSCNLLQGHTEHHTAPWRPQELVRSLVDTVEARCTARTVRASEEEAAIKEYMREIENYFLGKLNKQLDECNREDRGLMKAVSSSSGVTFCDRKGWPSAFPLAPVTANGSATNLTQFSSLLTDDSLARLVREIRDRLAPSSDGLTVTKWPRMHGSVTPIASSSPTASPVINGRSPATNAADTTGNEDEDEMQSLTNVSQHFYSFAAVLPNVEPLEFAQLLEQQQEYAPRLRSRSHSVLPPRGITPSIEQRVHSRAQSPSSAINKSGGGGLNGTTPLSVHSSIDVDGDKRRDFSPSSFYSSSARTDFVRNDHRRKTIPTSTVVVSGSRTPPTPNHVHIVQAMISDHPSSVAFADTTDAARSTSPPVASSSSSTAAVRTEPTQRLPLPKQESTESARRRFSLPSSRKKSSPTKEQSPPAAALIDTSGESNLDDLPKRQRQYSSPLTRARTPTGESKSPTTSGPKPVTAFNFGDHYMTRPIDVRPLDNDLLAVSDSCGGVYITDIKGTRVIHHVWLDGNSASSLCYLPFSSEQPNRPPILLISVLGQTDRSVRFYDANKFELLDEIPCPTQPEIDLGRSRWLSTDDRGSVFMISGDGKMSALWKFHSASPNMWALVKQAPNTRYQYLDVVQHMASANSVTLLTCNGIAGTVLLITISRAGKILAEQDFTDSYALTQYIRSPASAVVDYRGNMLIMDYYNGKLWILKSPKGNRQGGDRRLKLLSEFGGQQAMGISVTPSYWQSEQFLGGEQWCYVACFDKQRVHAIKYVSD